jgi:hypothetical protein
MWLARVAGSVFGVVVGVICAVVLVAAGLVLLWLWRRCGGGEAGEGLAAAAGSGRQAGCGAAGVVLLAGGPGGEDPLVADGEQAGEAEGERGQAREAGPAAGDVVGGGVLGGGEGPFGAGAPGVGAAVRGRGVVVFLRGLGKAPG